MQHSLHSLDARKKRSVLFVVMASLFVSAMDQTVVGTAMPRITQELGGRELYAWVFSAYMLASTVVQPIVGRMGDLYGRRRLLIAGVVFFLASSLFCGASQSMTHLIVSRTLQGIGAATISANAYALVGDLFVPAERGRYAGYLTSIYGIASIVGPLLGGLITDHASWRWVFFVNVPIGLFALAILSLVLPSIPTSKSGQARLDVPGALALMGTLLPLLLAFSRDATVGLSPALLVLFSALMLAAFLWVESRAAVPVLPLSVFRNTTCSLALATLLLCGASMYAVVVFLPLYVQTLLGHDATRAGLAVMPMVLGIVVTSVIGGQIVTRTGRYRRIVHAGLAIASVGVAVLVHIPRSSGLAYVMVATSALGLGLGFALPSLSLAVQNALPHSLVGVASSLTMVARYVGGIVGAGALGGILSSPVGYDLAAALPQTLRATGSALPMQSLFLLASVAMVGSLLCSWAIPDLPLRRAHEEAATDRAA
jgi:EmrB/QacA subfamily drug resistance transporter